METFDKWMGLALRVGAVTLFGASLCVAPRALVAQTTPSTTGQIPARVPAFGSPVEDNDIFTHVQLDQLEGRSNGNGSEFRWDGEGWIGTDMNRLWMKSEGVVNQGALSDGQHEALYDRPIPHMRYFDAQVGIRADLDSGPGREWAAVGIEGLAPYFFEFAPTLYIRDGGHVGGRINGSYDLLLTQRLIVQPETEVNFYSKDDPARGIGSGFSDMDAGLRLRYEITRKFAPYVGYSYSGKYGSTATYAHQSKEASSDSRFVFGLRVWY
jgi:copper resistance protein B